MAEFDTENNTSNIASIFFIAMGAISGILSIAILTGALQANEFLSPILGLLAILLLASGGLLKIDPWSKTGR